MVTLNPILRALEAQRRELLNQLDAVDRAIAALNSIGTAVETTPPDGPDVPAGRTARAVHPRRVASRRVLKEAHLQALIAGGRKARQARDAAKGLARDVPDDSFVPAIGTRGDRQLPRLVKRPART